jgi:hypothetical protein
MTPHRRSARRPLAPLASLALALGGCSGNPQKPADAAIDTVVAGDGPCGAETFFTGELVDFFNADTTFCGIFMASLQVHGDASRTGTTNPNGRFQLCLAPAATTQVDVTPPTGMSECSNPRSTYAVPGMLIANKAVIDAGGLISARSFTVAKAPSFAFDAAKAQVFVHVDGTPRAVSITGTHDASQVWNGSVWAAGDTAADVYFPNLDPTAGTTAVTVAGGAIGTGSVPIAAGTFTYVTVIAN